MQTTEETNNEYLQAKQSEKDHEGLMYGAQWSASHYIPPTDADIAEAGPEWKPSLPVMEVEELEVININLSDYPLPENVTTYDWWWA